MKGQVVMVTGGAGFVGSHLVEALLAQDNEVHVFDITPLDQAFNLKEVVDHPNFYYFRGNLCDPEHIRKFWRKDAEIIFHFASVVGIKNYIVDPLKLVDISVIGTRYILEEAAKTGTRILFSSTSEIFGKNTDVPWSEDSDRVLGPTYVDRWSYSSSKAVCEHMLYGMHKNCQLPFTIVRFFNVYGPRQNPYFVVSQSIHKVLNGEQPLLYDDGRMTRCFTFVEDIIKGVLIAAESPKAVGEAFNLGNSIEVDMKYVIETVLREAGSATGYKIFDTQKEYGRQYEDIIRRVPKVSKAKNILGWQAEIQIDEGIRKTIEWARCNPWWLS